MNLKIGDNTKNISICGIHGAAGLLMSTGAGLLISFIINRTVSSLTTGNEFLTRFLFMSFAYITIFAIFGAYIGYVFEGKDKALRLSISGAIAGILCGFIDAGLSEWARISGEAFQPAYYPIIIAAAGLVFGLRKTGNLLLPAAFGALGGAGGYGVYLLGMNLRYYLNYLKADIPAMLLSLLLLLIAVGIPGVFISLGMYFNRKIHALSTENSGGVKVIRIIGLALTALVLLIFTIFSMSMSHYGNSSSTVEISSENSEFALYLPVLIDNEGNILEMYKKPEIRGDGTTAIIDTELGKALKVTGSGRIWLSMEHTHIRFMKGDAKDFVYDLHLSLSDHKLSEVPGESIDIQVYSGNDGVFLEYSLKQDSGEGSLINIESKESIRLTKGWQTIRLSVRRFSYD